MRKSLIGVILTLIGFGIILLTIYTNKDLFSCQIMVGIGFIIAMIGLAILSMRFRKWGYS